ncbi:serine/threonine-protein phosphatase 2A 56 kDa regulatory subunit delta isoform-like [Engraulis encrasicolus]|uniref:serine/threonine-protein phosphatase 2A 56 kDa regulatory subunit delta isoform-like n=1 Tax=Engraulis encrasicolus TaxID=184585 RepID=UPI002FD08BAB
MPNKSKKDKESPRSGRSRGRGKSENHNSENESSTKKDESGAPPTTQLLRVKQPSSATGLKKERRLSNSCFPISNNRELQRLQPLKVAARSKLPTGPDECEKQ